MHLGFGHAARFSGVAAVTLRRWERAGVLLPTFRTPGGHRRYAVIELEDFLKNDADDEDPHRTIVYARVSSHDQKDDPDRQAEHLRAHCAAKGWHDVEVIRDSGSGLNYAEKGIRRLVAILYARRIERLVSRTSTVSCGLAPN